MVKAIVSELESDVMLPASVAEGFPRGKTWCITRIRSTYESILLISLFNLIIPTLLRIQVIASAVLTLPRAYLPMRQRIKRCMRCQCHDAVIFRTGVLVPFYFTN